MSAPFTYADPELPLPAEGRPATGAAVERRHCLPETPAGPDRDAKSPPTEAHAGPAVFSEAGG